MGEDNPACKYPDGLVAQARHLYDHGMTLKAISAELGPCFQTIHDWVKNRRRKTPVRVIARRVKTNTPLSGIGSETSNDKGLREAADLSTQKPIPDGKFHDLA